jgi:uncharacterized protein GlcG (DUF336 family)
MVRLADVRRVIAGAEKHAAEIGQPTNIAVADEGCNIAAHAFDIATRDPASHSRQFFGIHPSNNSKIMTFAGGIPLKKNGKEIGKWQVIEV